MKYYIDDDNYLACEDGDVYESVVGEIAQKHVEPLSKILDSYDDLLKACKATLEFIGRSNKTNWNNEITPVLEQAIAKAEQ